MYGVVRRTLKGKDKPWSLYETEWTLVKTFNTREDAQQYIDERIKGMFQLVTISYGLTESNQSITLNF